VVDILEVYYCEHVKKVKDYGAVDEYLTERCKYALDFGDRLRAQSLLERIVGYARVHLPDVSDMLANSLVEDGQFSKAYSFFFKCKNE
jgi:hypothetical protein